MLPPTDEPNNIRQLTHGSRELVGGVDTDGSSVVFQRNPDGQKWEIWVCDRSGDDLRRLNTDDLEVIRDVWGISATGGQILFTARGPDNHRQIWRIDEDTGSPLPVTATENGAYGPSLAPDGSWFVYTMIGTAGLGSLGSEGIWKQAAGGRAPVLLVENATFAVISPDGENIACEVWREDALGKLHNHLEVIPAKGGAPLISVGLDGDSLPRWQPDGLAITYRNPIDHQVWLQSLDGRPPKQLTHFDTGRTLSHAWSPDGKWLYLVREEVTSDAVLIRDF